MSKGGTIELGLLGAEAELEGKTDVTVKGSQGTPDVGDEMKLKDTIVDNEVTGVPPLSGTVEMTTDNLTVKGSLKG